MTRQLPLILACLWTVSAAGQTVLLNTRLHPSEILETGQGLELDLQDYFQSFPTPGPVATFTIRMPQQEGVDTFNIDGNDVPLMRYKLQSGESYEDPRDVEASAFVWEEHTVAFQLLGDEAPLTVANFMTYANDGVYANTIVHRNESTGRVFQPGGVANFTPLPIIQSGGFRLYDDPEKFLLEYVPTRPPILFEETRSNEQGTLSMARGSFPDSATSQFFINLEDNRNAFGSLYTVFGELLNPDEALPVIDQFADAPVYDLSSPYASSPNVFPRLPFTTIPLYAPFPYSQDSYARFKSITVSAGDPAGVTYSWDWVDEDEEVSETEAANRAAFDISIDGSGLIVNRLDSGSASIEVTGTKGDESASFTIDLVAYNAEALERFPNSEIKQDGILESSWFGQLKAETAPYVYPHIFHLNHGPQYVAERGVTTDTYLQDTRLDSWLFTSPVLYPYLYVFSLEQWVYYGEGTGNGMDDPRYFYLLEADEPAWVSEADL